MGTNYTGTPVYIGNTPATIPVNGAGYYMPAGYGIPTQLPATGTGSVINMLPTQRNTAGAYLPQNNIPVIASNQSGVAVELQSDTSVDALDQYWSELLARFSGAESGLLTPYVDDVFFAVDEQGIGDLGAGASTARLYRLRIGPIATIDEAQTLCNKLIKQTGGKSPCHVVRMQ